MLNEKLKGRECTLKYKAEGSKAQQKAESRMIEWVVTITLVKFFKRIGRDSKKTREI